MGFLVKSEKPFPGTVLGSLTMTLSLPQPKATIIVDTFFPLFFHCGNLPSPPCSREWVSEDPVHVKWRHETCIAMWDIGCTTSLQRSSMPTPASCIRSWAYQDSDSPLNLPGTQRPTVVGLREQLPSEWLFNCYFRNLILYSICIFYFSSHGA